MRPTLNILTDELIAKVLDEAKRIMKEDHLITAEHTLDHWPKELYLTDPVIDRANREAWEVSGSVELYERACQEVDTRLASYEPIETDPEIDAAMRQLVIDGLEQQEDLPTLPPPPEKKAKAAPPGRRGRAGRRRRAAQ